MEERQEKKTSDAQIKAVRKYDSATYDRLMIRVRNDSYPTLEEIRAFCKAHGMTLNGFVMEAISEKMDRMSKEEQK